MTPLRPFAESLRDYERWLTARLRGDLWADDLAYKHDQMRESAFVFLRATYWRWAETILTTCPELAGAPVVQAIGDVHLENYGVWRDVEGRLTWGINDLDEAAEMPYPLDLVRLAASGILCRVNSPRGARAICADVLEGYLDGLRKPRPFSLDEKRLWLRTLFVVPENERARFWTRLEKLDGETDIPRKYRVAIESRLPGADCLVETFARRQRAGVGSLGRPRWVGIARWRGGRVVREAKALVPSGWTRVYARSTGSCAAAINGGPYRAKDPWYAIAEQVVVRRLSPNSRKIEGKSRTQRLVQADMLHAMGYELANIHLGGHADARRRIEKDLARRDDRWLERAAATAAEFVTGEYKMYVRS